MIRNMLWRDGCGCNTGNLFCCTAAVVLRARYANVLNLLKTHRVKTLRRLCVRLHYDLRVSICKGRSQYVIRIVVWDTRTLSRRCAYSYTTD